MTTPKSGKRPRWARRVGITALLLACVLAFHAPILRTVASILVADIHTNSATAIVVLEGDRRFDVADQLHCSGAKMILLVRCPTDRLERSGIVPRSDEIARRELLKRHIFAHDVQVLPDVANGRAQIVTALTGWLKQHPERSVDLLCDRFTSRTWNVLVERADDSRIAARVHIVPLADRQFDETNWWHSKSGARAVINGYLILGFHILHSGDEPEWVERSDADLQASFSGGTSE